MEDERFNVVACPVNSVEIVANAVQPTCSKPTTERAEVVGEEPFIQRPGKRVCTGEEPSGANAA